MSLSPFLRRVCSGLALGFTLISTPLQTQPACGSCPFPPCPCPCTLDEIAVLIEATDVTTLSPSLILTPGGSSLVVRKNSILYVYTFTPANQTTQVTTYLPIKQFGNTGLYFYREPDPGQPLGGWKPVKFVDDSSTLPPYWAAYFKCNRLPYLSASEVNQITQLFLPGCCCPPCK